MAAVLRVKRRNDDEPLNALLIACKRCKTAEDEAIEEPTVSPLTAVLKFAGTVKNQEDNVVEHLVKTLGKDELKSNYKRHPVDIINKVREKTKESSAENRYKVINCIRSLDTSNVEEFEDKVMTVIDVEDSVSCAVNKDSKSEKSESYVYDLYYAQTGEDVLLDDMVSIHALDQNFDFFSYRDDRSEHECESEDSNSESNWRNDYPDSEHSEDSIDEDDMRNAVMNMQLEDGSDLSSDDDFVYAVDEKDVEAYGFKYAKYKARIKEELDENDSECSEYSGVCIIEEQDENESHEDSD